MLVSVGNGNFVETEKITGVLKPGSAPMRKLKEQSRHNEKLVDATGGKPTRSFILMDNLVLIMSSNTVTTIAERIEAIREGGKHGL